MSKSFAAWLLEQKHRDGWIGDLATAAGRDPLYPRDGDVLAVSKRLNALGADGDMHQALEDAELDWLAL